MIQVSINDLILLVPFALIVAVLFGLQVEQVRDKPAVIFLIAIPLIIQGYGNFAFGSIWAW